MVRPAALTRLQRLTPKLTLISPPGGLKLPASIRLPQRISPSCWSRGRAAWRGLAQTYRLGISVVYPSEGVGYCARIAKWGNSLGVRIPKAVAREVGLGDGSDVEVRVSGRELVLAPASREYRLNELVGRMTRENRHDETDWGAPVGKESW